MREEDLRQSVRQFMTIYGVDGTHSRRNRARTLHQCAEAVGTASFWADVQSFLEDYYPDVAGTALTGADGLDMDEAYAADLWRRVQAFKQQRRS